MVVNEIKLQRVLCLVVNKIKLPLVLCLVNEKMKEIAKKHWENMVCTWQRQRSLFIGLALTNDVAICSRWRSRFETKEGGLGLKKEIKNEEKKT